MGALREKMKMDIDLKNLMVKTIEFYVSCMRGTTPWYFTGEVDRR